ncbi:MAG: glycosyltransferase family 4 protein [Bacteroidales bacterium]|jgi:glycosyltransferase involved in cell wall biosynthesis|nr:glycosyltransferase family 4 protein [Bacteroidales bacterium]
MKLLILTQYFPPEIGAPQNRLYELSVRLKKKGVDVSIITAMPNYPKMEVHKAYKGKKYCFEKDDNNLNIHRCWIYVKKSKSIIPRLMNYFSFVLSSLFYGLIKVGRQDILLVESPPLFLGISAYLLSKAKRAKLVFNVSDLWPESAEKLNIINNRLLLKMATFLEEFLYKKSSLITGQTQGIVGNIKERFPKKKVYWLKNGVDLNFYNVNKEIDSCWREENGYTQDDFILFYGGIIGLAQGLEVILYAAEELKNYENIKFVLLGEGPEKERLQKIKKELRIDNVKFFDAVEKNYMQRIIISTDATIIPLKKLDLFKGAIPSKIFENLALKKPILLGLEGEAKQLFIDEGDCGLAFIPEDFKDLKSKILSLYNDKALCKEKGENGFKYVSSHFNRDIIAQRLYEELLLL